MSYLQPSQQIRRLLALCMLALSAVPAHGIDMGHWARHQQAHRDWTSLDFRSPTTGLFVASRAGTEDPGTRTTLTLTMAPVQGCVADAVLVQETDAPVSAARDDLIHVTIEADDSAFPRLPARLVMEPGDLFIFAQLLSGLPFDSLKNHQVLAVRLPNGQSARFSLAGFDDAWSTAEAVCRSFLAP